MKMTTGTFANRDKESNYDFLSLMLSEYFWLLCFTCLVCSNAIETATSFSYADEFATTVLPLAITGKKEPDSSKSPVLAGEFLDRADAEKRRHPDSLGCKTADYIVESVAGAYMHLFGEATGR